MNSTIQRNDDTGDFKVVPNPEYVPAPYKAAMATFYKGEWHEWIETDPTAPMIPPQFRNTENNSPPQ